jgi:hypothetical protein
MKRERVIVTKWGEGSGKDGFQGAGAVAVFVDNDPAALKEGEPQVAEGGVFGEDEVFPELDARAASADYGGAVVEEMACADVAAVHEGTVVEEGGPIGFFGGFEAVQKVGEQLALCVVAALGAIEMFTFGGDIVAHPMRGDFDPDAFE